MQSKLPITETVQSEGMDMGQKVMIGVIVAVVVLGGYFVLRPAQNLPKEEKIDEPVTSAAVIAPVIDGDKTYTLGGVDWVFEPQSTDETGAPTTRVRLKLNDLRRNDVAIDVGLYRLGTYRGDCESYTALSDARALPDAGAIGFAQCWAGDAGRQLAVFQEGNNLVVKVRTVTESAEQLDPLTPILTIDVTKIVQPL